MDFKAFAYLVFRYFKPYQETTREVFHPTLSDVNIMTMATLCYTSITYSKVSTSSLQGCIIHFHIKECW